MDYRRLGRTGLKVSELCLGTMQWGWTADEATSFAVMDAFVEAGGNFIDTADVYSRWVEGNPGGVSEQIIGRWMKARGNRDADRARHQGPRPDVGRPERRGSEPRPPDQGVRGFAAPAARPTTSTSIRRTLDAETRRSTRRCARSTTWCAPARCATSAAPTTRPGGWRRRCGPATSYGLARYDSLQPHYNLAHRAEFERELKPLCEEEGIGVIPYSPLAGGFLTGKYRRDSDAAQRARRGHPAALLQRPRLRHPGEAGRGGARRAT